MSIGGASFLRRAIDRLVPSSTRSPGTKDPLADRGKEEEEEGLAEFTASFCNLVELSLNKRENSSRVA